MFNSILIWLVETILDYLMKQATGVINKELKQLSDDKKLKVINDANVKAYLESKDRSDRVQKALALLNRS